MKIALIFLTLSLLVFAACPSPAQDRSLGTGQTLQDQCSKAKGFGLGYCVGFAKGALFAAAMGNLSCPPNDVTQGEAEQVLVEYLNDHAEVLHEDDATLALRAFHTVWPCKGEASAPTKKP